MVEICSWFHHGENWLEGFTFEIDNDYLVVVMPLYSFTHSFL